LILRYVKEKETNRGRGKGAGKNKQGLVYTFFFCFSVMCQAYISSASRQPFVLVVSGIQRKSAALLDGRSLVGWFAAAFEK